MIKNQRPVNVVHHFSMMVDDYHVFTTFKYVGALHKMRRVGIHYKQKRISPNLVHRFLRRDEKVLFFIGCVIIHQRIGETFFLIQNNLDMLVHTITGSRKTNAGTHRIQIREFMPHNQHIVAVFNQLPHSGSQNPAAHLGPFLNSLRDSAVKLKILSGFYRNLIAAASQSHLQGLTGIRLVLFQAVGSHTCANRKRNRHPLGGKDIFRFIQDWKTLLNHSVKIALFQHNQITIPLQTLNKALGAVDSLFQHMVDLT